MLGEYPIYPFTCIFGVAEARQDYIASRDAATTAARINKNHLGNKFDVGNNRT
jgi:hypothetical protein